ncbi:Protein of unknown function, partial [Gryllus bimaculatus]
LIFLSVSEKRSHALLPATSLLSSGIKQQQRLRRSGAALSTTLHATTHSTRETAQTGQRGAHHRRLALGPAPAPAAEEAPPRQRRVPGLRERPHGRSSAPGKVPAAGQRLQPPAHAPQPHAVHAAEPPPRGRAHRHPVAGRPAAPRA